MDKLAVLIPTLGNSPFIDETIESVTRIPEVDSITIISTDSADMAQKCFEKRISVFQEGTKRLGLFHALNKAIWSLDDSIGYVTYVNDDDILLEGVRENLIALKEASENVGFSYGRVLAIDEFGRRLFEHPLSHKPQHFGKLLNCGVIGCAQPGTIYRRSFLDSMNGFSTEFQLSADYELLLRGLGQGWDAIFCKVLCAKFRIRPGQLSSNRKLASQELRSLMKDFGEERRLPSIVALLAFRLINLQNYIDRLRRIGMARSSSLYRSLH